jgi:NADH dehydrogenase
MPGESMPLARFVIDRKNHHTLQPLLYQVATTMLSPGQVASPIRAILRRHAILKCSWAKSRARNSEREP